jgi:hypothetical protein
VEMALWCAAQTFLAAKNEILIEWEMLQMRRTFVFQDAPGWVAPSPAAGEYGAVTRSLLEPFWPSRRAHAYDQFCR